MTCPQVIDRLDNRCAGGHSDWPDSTCHYYPRGWYAQRCARVSPPRCEPESRWCEVATEPPAGCWAAEGRDGPPRWRVLHDGRWMGIHTDRATAFAQAKLLRQIYGVAMRVVRTTTVSRRWRVGGEECLVQRESFCAGWSWSAVGVVGMRRTYAEAVEAAERCARGQR